MMAALLNTHRVLPILLLCLQSLTDVAHQEAERRKLIDQQGIEAKVIDEVPPETSGNLSVSSGVSSSARQQASKERASSKDKPSINGIRTTLRKLDRSILQTQERLESLRARLQSERWVIPKTGRISGRSDPERTQSQLRQEIAELQRKLEQLLQERAEAYDRGKKAGFLPGELTGKGIIP